MTYGDTRWKQLCAYLHAEDLMDNKGSDPDAMVIMALYDAALSYLGNAGISEMTVPMESMGTFALVVNAMVLDWYDNRGSASVNGSIAGGGDLPSAVAIGLRPLINQLKAVCNGEAML